MRSFLSSIVQVLDPTFAKKARPTIVPVQSVAEETGEYDEELAWIRQFCLYILSHIRYT